MAQQTGYGITEFYNIITTRGLARNNVFRIKSIGGIFGVEDSDLLIYAQGGSIPSRQISSSIVSFKTFDYIVPMTANYPENASWPVTFYCDSGYRLRDILETWSRSTFDEHKNISIVQGLVDIELVLIENSIKNLNPLPKRLPALKAGLGSELIPGRGPSTALILTSGPTVPPVDPQTNGTPKEIRKYTLKGCFLSSVGSTSYSVGNNGEFATVPINIAFQYVISENSPNGN